MDISSEIVHKSNSSTYFFNGTELNYFNVSSVMYITSILLSFPPNSYVIWLIVTGTGNGLAAEFFILNISVCGILLSLETLILVFNDVLLIPWTVLFFMDGLFIIGRPLFDCVICVERYLAVVHPVIFLKFKPLRYRLMCSAVAWLATVVFGGLNAIILSWFFFYVYFIFLLIYFLVFLSIQLYCCLAVLRALKQSGPGERGREREEENHMKRRAFNLVLILTVTMVIIYTQYVVSLVVFTSENKYILVCVAQMSFVLAGLVQPVLFLNRVGKLNFIKC